MANQASTLSACLHVLLVEDDPEVARTVCEGLETARFSVDHVSTVAGGRQKLATRSYDALILDIALPDGSGLELADTLRASRSPLPVLILTARSTVDERLEGFRHGADDYLCKPFAVDELIARLRALLRRVRPERQHILKYGDVELDLLERVVRRNELQASLSARETELLVYLIRHSEEPLSRSRILEEVWGDDAELEGNVLNVYVNYLRNKLEQGDYPRLLHTVRGVGYMFSQKSPEELS